MPGAFKGTRRKSDELKYCSTVVISTALIDGLAPVPNPAWRPPHLTDDPTEEKGTHISCFVCLPHLPFFWEQCNGIHQLWDGLSASPLQQAVTEGMNQWLCYLLTV
jgi:hypothetical protein